LFAILLWIAGGLAILASRLGKDVSMANLGYAIIGVIFINAFFTFLQEYRAEKASQALKKLMPYQANVIREGRETRIPAKQIVPGDVIIVKGGDRVPADARIIKAVDLAVDNSLLTGESEPQTRKDLPEKGEMEPANLLYAGTTVVKGNGISVVYATGMATEFGKIAHLTQEIAEAPTPLQRELAYVTRIITVIAIGLGFVFFIAGELIGISSLCHRHHSGKRARGAAANSNTFFIPCKPENGEKRCTHKRSLLCRNSRQCNSDMHR
jgi:sodium/potassium-transporting ATPase subunit alpha